MPALSAHWLLIAQQKLPLKKMDVAHRSNYCMRVWLCIMISQGHRYLAMLRVSTLWYNCLITTMKWKRTIEKPQGSFLHRVQLYSKCLPSPVRQKKGTDVRDGRSCRPKLRQRHDVLKGDVRLRANVHHTHILRRAAVVVCDSGRGSGGGSPEDLDNDGVSPDGLHHCLLMLDLGEVTRIHLRGKRRWKGANHILFQRLNSLGSDSNYNIYILSLKRGDLSVGSERRPGTPFFLIPHLSKDDLADMYALFSNNLFHIHTWEPHSAFTRLHS